MGFIRRMLNEIHLCEIFSRRLWQKNEEIFLSILGVLKEKFQSSFSERERGGKKREKSISTTGSEKPT